jgi:hypothetical protein
VAGLRCLLTELAAQNKWVMAILHTGRRTATYRLGTLSALIDYSEGNAPLFAVASL